MFDAFALPGLGLVMIALFAWDRVADSRRGELDHRTGGELPKPPKPADKSRRPARH